MKLNDITNYIQSICQNISTVLDVDVTVVSKDLIRIAGTGIFENKVSEKISDNSAYSKILTTGEPYIFKRESENSCKVCIHNKDCKELADICSPIKIRNSWYCCIYRRTKE